MRLSVVFKSNQHDYFCSYKSPIPGRKVVRFIFLLLLLFMVVARTRTVNAVHVAEDVNNSDDRFIVNRSFTGNANDDVDDGGVVADIRETPGVVTNTEPEPITERMKAASFDSAAEVDDDDDGNPSEVQKAVCTVTAGDVKASAEAVTTKVLRGVCGSDEMNLAIKTLEIKLYKELEDIKSLLKQHLELKQVQSIPNRNIPMTQWQPSIITTSTTEMPEKSKEDIYNMYHERNKPTTDMKSQKIRCPYSNCIDEDLVVTTPAGPKWKSLPRWRGTNAREHEVLKFNNTMLSDRDLKVFTYYWKLDNVSEHIANGASKTLESPVFSIKGKPLHIRAVFHHLQRDFLYLQLEYATINTTNSNRNNIILDTGGLFKEIAIDKILLKYKISILDQNNQRAQDLVSQEFINFESGFLVPNSALLASSYVKKNALLIQVFLYL